MKKLVLALPNLEALAALQAYINKELTDLKATGAVLTPEQRRKLRKMGDTRTGYANMILAAAKQHIAVLSRDLEPTDLEKLIAYKQKIREARFTVLAVYEWLNDTEIALGVDAMMLTDGMYNNLQDARDRDPSIDMAVQEAVDYNSRFGQQMADEEAEEENQNPNGNQNQGGSQDGDDAEPTA